MDVTPGQPQIATIEEVQARLAAIVTASADAIVSKTLEGRITSWNAAAERMFGYSASEMMGQSVRRIIPAHLQHEEDMILAKIAVGERLDHYETVRVRKDGRLIDVSVTVSPLHDSAGHVIGAAKIARDISERKRTEERILTLMREVNHRAKNMLGLVQAMARQTTAATSAEFVRRFSARIQALSANLDLLVQNEWQGVELHDLVCAHLAVFEDLIGNRITMSGPQVRLNAASAQGIGLALHELATNASKFGSLSSETGTVAITWSCEADAFSIAWEEVGGPTVVPPERWGFGKTIITYAAETSVEGRCDYEFAPEGVRWRLRCPLPGICEPHVSRSLGQDQPSP